MGDGDVRPVPVQMPGWGAATARLLGAGLSATAVALCPVPAHWLDAERSLSATAAVSTPTLAVWHGLARAIPVGDLQIRTDLLASALVLVNAMAATMVAHALFRGPGRWAAAVTAGPLAAVTLTRWSTEVGGPEAVPGLVVSLLATLSLASVVAARVHVGRVTPVAAARAMAAVSAIALVSVRAAVVMLLLTLPMLAATARTRRLDPTARPPWSRWLSAAGLAMAPILVASLVLFVLHGGAPTLNVSSTRLQWPALAVLTGPAAAGIVYPAVALAAVMTFVLRWRGGPWLWAWALAPLVLVDDRGPWVPHSVLLVVIAVAASGWVWLAGLWPRKRAVLVRVMTGLTAIGLCALSWLWTGSPRAQAVVPMPTAALTTVAVQRPLRSLVSVYTRGLIAPGDVFVAHNRWLAEALEDRSRVDGWRPDVAVIRAETLNDQMVARLSLDWQGTGRRILSDSYNLGGHWRATWAVDSGPLFWFVGEHALADPEFTDLSELLPQSDSRAPERMRQWHRLAIERARFRRALQEPSAALAALPLPTPRFRSLLTRLQLVRSARSEQTAGSELPATLPSPLQTEALDTALVSAEAGDLLFSYGEQERATELLIAAANDGYVPAWGALARWQLRAGSTSAATATLTAIAGTAALRSQALSVLRWLLSRDRIADARELLVVLGPPRPGELSAPDTAHEVAARLRLLDAMAVHPPGFPATPPAATVGRR